MASPYDQDDEDDDYKDIQAGRITPESLIPQRFPATPAPVAVQAAAPPVDDAAIPTADNTAPANPVIRGFDTPGAASAPTTPTPAPDAAPPVQTFPTVPTAAPAPAPTQVPVAQDQQPAQADPAQYAQPDASAPPAPAQPAAQASAADMAREYQQYQAGQLKYLKAQGAQTQVLPTGAEVPATDPDGNQLYKPALVSPFERGDDGRGYSVVRDQYGNQHYQDILTQGEEGKDFHTDPATGEQSVHFMGRKEVIGQDPLVPKINDAKTQAQNLGQTITQAGVVIAQAENGVPNAGPMRAASLSDLRQEATGINNDLKPLQKQLADLNTYAPDGAQGVDAADITEKQQLQDQIKFKSNRLALVQNEVDSRDSVIADARQQHDQARQAQLNASTSAVVMQRVRAMGGTDAVQTDLETVANGGALPADRAAALATTGLLRQEQQPDGSSIMRVTSAGVPMLSDDTQKALAADPSKFVVSDQPSLPHVQAAGEAVASAKPDPATATPPAPVATAAPKNYTVGDDGDLHFAPGNLSAGLTEAAQNGLMDPKKLADLLPQAQAADKAAADQQRIATENPAAWKAFVSGAGRGAVFLAGSAPGAAAGAEGGAFLGPVGAAVGGIVGGLVTGTVAEKAYSAAINKLGQYSDTIKSFQDASQLHPNYDAAGNLVSFAAGLPKIAGKGLAAGAEALAGRTAAGSALGDNAAQVAENLSRIRAAGKTAQAVDDAGNAVNPSIWDKATSVLQGTAKNYTADSGVLGTIKNLSRLDAINKAAGVGLAQRTGAVAARVGGAAAFMVGVDTAIKEGQKALGMSDQGQTLSGAAQAAAIGAFASGHNLTPEGYTPGQVANIVTRASLRTAAGLDWGTDAVPAEAIPSHLDINAADALKRPLTESEMEIAARFNQAVTKMQADGTLPQNPAAADIAKVLARTTGEQMTTGGKPMGVAAVKIAPEAEADISSPNATGHPPSSGSTGGSSSPTNDTLLENGPPPAATASPEKGTDARTIPVQQAAKNETPSVAPASDGSVPPSAQDTELPAGGEHDVASFKTSQGSEYTVDNTGHTTRFKASPGEGQGQYHAPMPAVFVRPADQEKLMDEMRGGGRMVLGEQRPDGSVEQIRPDENTDLRGREVNVYVVNRQTGAVQHAAPATTTPGVGLHPIEMRYNGDQKWLHVGNAITSITQADNAPAKTSVGGKPAAPTEAASGPEQAEDGKAWNVGFASGNGVATFRSKAEAHAFAADSDLDAKEPVYGDKQPSRKYAEDMPGFKSRVPTNTPRSNSPSTSASSDQPPVQTTPNGETSVELGKDSSVSTPNKAASQPAAKEGVESSGNGSTLQKRGSTQLTLSPEEAKPFQNFARSIPESAVYSEKDASGKEQYGRELEPHVTSLYGLTGEGDTPAAVSGVATGHGPVTMKMGKLSLFSHPDRPYDVLKADVHSDSLHELNGKLRTLPHSSDFPDYHPHLTIAYVKKGLGEKFVKASGSKFEGREVTADSLTHSSADRVKTEIPLRTPDTAPITRDTAKATIQRLYGANAGFLRRQGIASANFETQTEGESGLQFRDGKMEVDPEKFARHLTIIRDNQRVLGLDATVDDAVHAALVEEGIHGLQDQIAKAAGFEGIREHYSDEQLPDAALPDDWEAQGRAVRADWDVLPKWLKKAEFVRMIVQHEASGKITEALYQRAEPIVERLQELAKGAGVHAKLREYIDRLAQAFAASQLEEKKPEKKQRRTFELPHAPTGVADMLDHLKEQGGIITPVKGDTSPEYDGAPKLGGIYHQTVFGGKTPPDKMAAMLHEDYGVGDGSVGKMWEEIRGAVQARQTAREEQKRVATLERQAKAFDKATSAPSKTNAEQINTANLAIGDKLMISGQELTVTKITPDEDVTLSDHTVFGVQKVAEGKALYVEKGPDDPDAVTPTSTVPTLRPGEKGTGDMFQGEDQPFNLMGETGTDGGKIQAAKDRAAREAEEAKAVADRDQMDFTKPTSGASKELLDQAREAFNGLFASEAKPAADALPAAPASPLEQAGLPRERRAQFLDLADKMDAEGINTPEKVARFLTDLAPDGRARKYSQALWQFIGAADPSKAGVHDWPTVYAGLEATSKAVPQADEPSPAGQPVSDPKTAREKSPLPTVHPPERQSDQSLAPTIPETTPSPDATTSPTTFKVGDRVTADEGTGEISRYNTDNTGGVDSVKLALDKGGALTHWIPVTRLKTADAPASKAPAPATAPIVQNDYQTAGSNLADWVQSQIADGKKFSLKQLYDEADKHFGGTQADGKYTFKDATDALELGVNRLILKSGFPLTHLDAGAARSVIDTLNKMLDLLPTQGRQRNEEMEGFQQFSTPPQLAFAANWVAAPRRGEVMLEPSAGIGGLASFSKAAGAQVIVNELSTRRLQLLKALPFDRFFNEDAEQLHNILPADVQPTVVVMNPPFSQTAGRMAGKTDLMVGARHLEVALKRLAPGGRLVAIVGRGMAMDAPTFRDWWKRIGAANRVRANIEVSGEEYAKYGTKFDNRLLVIDKTAPTPGEVPIGGRVEKVAGFTGDVRSYPQ